MAVFPIRCMEPWLLYILLLYLFLRKSRAITPDGEALLSFKSAILSSDGILPLWRPEDPDPCNWKGVTCDQKTKRVIYLSLKNHKLSGSISPDLGKLEHLRVLALYNNNFYGNIPSELGNCTELQGIYLQGNYLSGVIPNEFGNLSELEYLDISSNSLSGSIPPSLGKLKKLITFNVSNNFLTGPIPFDGMLINFAESSFMGNRDLCGNQINVTCKDGHSPDSENPSSAQNQGGKKKYSGRLLISASATIGALLLVALMCFWGCFLYKKFGKNESGTIAMDVSGGASIVMFHGDLPYSSKDIIKKLETLNEEHIIGCGGFGTVYKLAMDDGNVFALKRIVKMNEGFDRFFERELEILGSIKHRYLVNLRGYCNSPTSKLLIYDFLPGGSLDEALHERSEQLDWDARLNIIMGAAKGLAYLHHDCSPRITKPYLYPHQLFPLLTNQHIHNSQTPLNPTSTPTNSFLSSSLWNPSFPTITNMDSKAAFAPDTPSLDSSSSGSVPPYSNHSVIDNNDDNSIKNHSLELGRDDTVSNSDVGFAAVNDSPSVGPLDGEKSAPQVSGNGGSVVLDDDDDDDDQFVVGGEKVKSLEEGESEEGVGDKGFVQNDEIVGSNAVENEGLVETASEKKVEVDGGELGEGVSESRVLSGENGKVESGSLEPESGTGDGDAVVEAVNVDLLRSGVAVIGDTEEIKYSKIKGMESPSAVPVDNEFDRISDDVEEPIVLDSGKKIELEVSKLENNEGDTDISSVGKSRTSLSVVEDDTDVKEDANLVDSGNASVAYGEEKQETEADAGTETEQIKPLMAAEVQHVAASDKVDEADNVAVISQGLEDVTAGNSVVPESTELGAPPEGEENLEAHDEEKHHPDEEGENDGSDEENESMVFGSSDAAKQFLEELERASAVGSRSGGDSSQDYSQRIDGQIATDSDEEVDTDEEGEGKELFDSSTLAALLKAATGVDTDGGTVTVSSQDGSRLFSVERPAGLGSSLRAVRPASRPARPNLFNPSGVTTGGDSDNNLSDEEKKKLEKLQQLRVNFLRLVHRLRHSPEESIASQVLYRLAVAAGRQTNQLFNLDTAKRTALQLEAEGKDDLNFSLNILVLGKTGVGKSATINSIFGEEKSVIHAFEPATSAVREITGTVDGVKIRVIDTPGLKSSGSEQGANRKILSSAKSFMKKCPPDIVLYVDRLDTQTRDLNDLPLLRSITSALGSSIWRNAIVTLTHAASAPPDGPSGSPLSYEVFVAQRSHVVQQSIGQAVGDLRMMNPSLMNPVSLVENHPSCRKNRDGEKVLPNGQTWRPQLLLLCYSMKILSEASSQSKPQDPFDHKKLFGFRVRSPPLPYLLSWLLQSRAHPKLSSDQGVENVDSDVDLADLSDSDDEEEEDEYDQLPPFKPLRKAQLARLTREQKKAYFEEYDYRVKLLQKKQWREELRRMREMKKKGKPAEDEYNYPGEDGDPENGAPAAVPVPLPDMALPPSFDGDNPAYRYRFLEPTSQFLARPVLDTHGWDHDCGYDGVNIEQSLALASRFPASVAVQLTKDKKEFNIHLDSSISAKHGENASSMAGFDIQNVGKQLAYVVRGETKFKNLKNNKTAAGVSVTFLGENVATGFKLEDQIALGKRLTLVGSTGTVRSQSDSAYGANLEVRLKEADYPIGQDQSSLGLSLVKWRNELALGANLQSQFSMGRSYKIAVRAGLNNKMSGQITVRTSSSEQLQLALVGLLPIATSIYKILRPGVSESYSMY